MEDIYFLSFLHISTADSNALFAVLVPPPEGGGELLSGDASDDPFPGCLQGPLVQRLACQLLLDPFEQEEVRRSKVRQIGQMLEPLDAVGGKPMLNDSGHMNWRIVPVEPPFLFNRKRPLLLELLEKVAQGPDNVFAVHRRTLGDNVAVDDVLVVKESLQHLFGPAGMDPGL